MGGKALLYTHQYIDSLYKASIINISFVRFLSSAYVQALQQFGQLFSKPTFAECDWTGKRIYYKPSRRYCEWTGDLIDIETTHSETSLNTQ